MIARLGSIDEGQRPIAHVLESRVIFQPRHDLDMGGVAELIDRREYSQRIAAVFSLPGPLCWLGARGRNMSGSECAADSKSKAHHPMRMTPSGRPGPLGEAMKRRSKVSGERVKWRRS